MGALAISDLAPVDGEPRVRDLRLGEVLGFGRGSDVRKLINRHRSELGRHGPLLQSEAMVSIGSGARRQVEEFWLNEAQALVVCMHSETPLAVEVRAQIIEVFLAWRHGTLQPASDLAAKVDRLTAMVGQLLAAQRPIAAHDPWAIVKSRHETAMTVADYQSLPRDMRAVVPTYMPVPGRKRIRVTKAEADPEVWTYICDGHRRAISIDAMRAVMIDRFGPARTPSRSGLGRLLIKLDIQRGMRG